MKTILSVEGVCKSFSGNNVLNDISFDIVPGEVHSVVGENGAGKSTLMKIIGGIYQADAGSIVFDGKQVHFSNPWQAMQEGISIVHQELSLVPNLNVAQNIFVRREKTNILQSIKWRDMYREAEAIFERIGVAIDPRKQVSHLSIGMQQIVEIAKAISFNAKIIIMDEPTSALSEKEVEQLYSIVRDLKESGVAIVFISHKLGEVFRISDRISVLRDGDMVGTVTAADSSNEQIIEMMVGRAIDNLYPPRGTEFGEEILQVRNLSNKYYQDVSFELREGEILGFAGLVGAGRTEVALSLFGIDKPDSGSMTLRGKDIMPKSPQNAIEEGIAYLTEDRKTLGLFLNMTVRRNIISSSLAKFIDKRGIMQYDAVEKESKAYVEYMAIRPYNDEVDIVNLSGGNQQKTLLAKWLCAKPTVLIADEPTRGVDVGAKSKIHTDLRALADQGIGVIVISSELPEVLGLSDRIAVFREGQITAILDGNTATQEEVMRYATQ